jgi:hypothetical protein
MKMIRLPAHDAAEMPIRVANFLDSRAVKGQLQNPQTIGAREGRNLRGRSSSMPVSALAQSLFLHDGELT